MLKGINKQIIEIKCTDNECFDKILLFVNSDKSHLPPEILRKNAVEIASIITGERKQKVQSCDADIHFNGCSSACYAVDRIVYVNIINIIDKICVNRRKSV